MDDETQGLIQRATRQLGEAPASAIRPRGSIDWRIAGALGALIALGPLLTIGGAGVLASRAQQNAARIEAGLAARMTAEAQGRSARATFRQAVRGAPAALWMDRIARVLPADARVAAMARSSSGEFEVQISTPDPDQLRSALRRDPAFAALRETGQRRAGAMMLVTMRGRV